MSQYRLSGRQQKFVILAVIAGIVAGLNTASAVDNRNLAVAVLTSLIIASQYRLSGRQQKFSAENYAAIKARSQYRLSGRQQKFIRSSFGHEIMALSQYRLSGRQQKFKRVKHNGSGITCLNTASAVDNRNALSTGRSSLRQESLNTASAVDNRNTTSKVSTKFENSSLNTASAVDNRNKKFIVVRSSFGSQYRLSGRQQKCSQPQQLTVSSQNIKYL